DHAHPDHPKLSLAEQLQRLRVARPRYGPRDFDGLLSQRYSHLGNAKRKIRIRAAARRCDQRLPRVLAGHRYARPASSSIVILHFRAMLITLVSRTCSPVRFFKRAALIRPIKCLSDYGWVMSSGL